MKRLFWTAWGVCVSIAAVSFFRPMAMDSQIADTYWLQVAAYNGGVRLLVLDGDPSVSPTAATSIERSKSRSRRALNAYPCFLYTVREHVLDEAGTTVDALVISLPFLASLLVIAAVSLLLRANKRWGAPLKLIWAELWRMPREKRRLFVYMRRGMIAVSMTLAICFAVLGNLSYQTLPSGAGFFGERFAIGRKRTSEYYRTPAMKAKRKASIKPGCGSDMSDIADVYAKFAARQKSQLGIEIWLGSIAFHLYKANRIPKNSANPMVLRFGGIRYAQGASAGPAITCPMFLYLNNPGPNSLGYTRTLFFPSWMLFVLLSAWPLIAFLRGPFRRAQRRFANRCFFCGYNLTGLIEPRCPECGTRMEPNWAIVNGYAQMKTEDADRRINEPLTVE